MTTQAHRDAIRRYQARARAEGKIKNYSLKFYYNTDQKIIEKLASVDNMTDYIRQLIYKDIDASSAAIENEKK